MRKLTDDDLRDRLRPLLATLTPDRLNRLKGSMVERERLSAELVTILRAGGLTEFISFAERGADHIASGPSDELVRARVRWAVDRRERTAAARAILDALCRLAVIGPEQQR